MQDRAVFFILLGQMHFKTLNQAASTLATGGIVAFPTETVWGLGANAKDLKACQKIYHIKNRPADNPLIIHVHSIEEISLIGEADALDKLHRWIPGPLTLILKKRDPEIFSCGLDTIGVRVPGLEKAREFIRLAGCPVAAPSANVSGKPSLTKYNDVVEAFKDKVDAIVEGPDCHHGIESTVLDLSGEVPVYIRPGVVSFEELLDVFPNLKRWEGGKIVSPGMKYRHYAPEGNVVVLSDLKNLEAGSAQIGFDLEMDAALNHRVLDNVQYAKDLYAFFVRCDREGIKKVYCQVPKEGVLYQALLHRLEKAAHR